MAQARALERRRQSIRNIRKITRSMELISTAQFKRAMDRSTAATAYTKRLVHLVHDLTRAGLHVKHPLLETRQQTKTATLLVLTANRGMCGGYNTAALRLATARWRQMEDTYDAPRLEVSGKRGIASLRFNRIMPQWTTTQFEHKPTFEEVDAMATRYLETYETGQLDRLEIVYTRFESVSRQMAVLETLLPMSELQAGNGEERAPDEGVDFDLLPSAESILDEVMPTAFRVKLFKCFLDAAVSEQTARMLAMKAATENADAIVNRLTMAYNRERQGQITNDLLEVISGAEALGG